MMITNQRVVDSRDHSIGRKGTGVQDGVRAVPEDDDGDEDENNGDDRVDEALGDVNRPQRQVAPERLKALTPGARVMRHVGVRRRPRHGRAHCDSRLAPRCRSHEFADPVSHLVPGGGPQFVLVQLFTAVKAGAVSNDDANPPIKPAIGFVMSRPALLTSC